MVYRCGNTAINVAISNTNGQWSAFIDALFTATSASCVTGLAVVDTGKGFTYFGQTVLILLIQIGGLGIMTITSLLSVGMGKRIDIKHRL
ncbi:MAG: potassium transporter TrkG [Phascolarctobacterium sp.]